jgi:osmotically-inducible protein OsmY
VRSLTSLLLFTLAGCAQTPAEAPATGTAGSNDTEKVATPATAQAGTISNVKGAQSAGSTGGPAGYHVIERNGTKYYCEDKPALGTRIKARTTCLTAEQYAREKQDAQDTMREKQGQRPINSQ